jgi:hypothetical protein
MFARIGVMREFNRRLERVFDLLPTVGSGSRRAFFRL